MDYSLAMIPQLKKVKINNGYQVFKGNDNTALLGILLNNAALKVESLT